MIKSVTVVNYLNERLKMELEFPEYTGFAITSITGIGPAKASINTSEISTGDGSTYNSARLAQRNIQLIFRYVESLNYETIEDLRQKSYKYFPVKKPVKLIFETTNRTAEITGYVETNEIEIFSNEEGSSISIICPDPFFYSSGNEGSNSTIFSGIESLFEFPFGDDELMELSAIRSNATATVLYTGDAEIGVEITIHALGEAKNITIYNVDTREVMKIDTDKLAAIAGGPLQFGDDIKIITNRGKKTTTLTREGKTINILNCLGRNADWFTVSKGDNMFAYDAEEGRNNLQFQINNKIVYEGI